MLGSTEAQWKAIFAEGGKTYRTPVLVMYNRPDAGAACGGVAQSAMGPFYCPNDQKVYLDTSFFREIESRFHGCQGKACQFSQAYVIAHEVGHHVQNLLGVLPKVQQQQQRMRQGRGQPPAGPGRVAGRLPRRRVGQPPEPAAEERGQAAFIEPGDVEAAMQTASAIGDDTLQRQATGRVVPDCFTHGSSAQRQRWFMTGLKEGNIAACNTFQSNNI